MGKNNIVKKTAKVDVDVEVVNNSLNAEKIIENKLFEKVLNKIVDQKTEDFISSKFQDARYVNTFINSTIDKKLLTYDIEGQLKAPLVNKINEELDSQGINSLISQRLEEKFDLIIKNSKDKIKEKLLKTRFVVNKKVQGLVHYQFEEVLKLIQTKEPIFLYGETGSGKTRIAIDVANALNLKHFSISANEQTSKVDFLGYYDAHSNLIKTPFREAYEKGGVYIIDEIDAANANVLTVLNSALSNGSMSFPDGIVNQHKHFICVCTANTTGDGSSMKYIGRNQLDDATLDRFIMKEIKYPYNIEEELVKDAVLEIATKIREYYQKIGSDRFLSTRKILQAQKLVEAGHGIREAYEILFNKDLMEIIYGNKI